MKTKAVFYHAGCPVCVAAEQNVAAALDPARFEVEIVHLGQSMPFFKTYRVKLDGVETAPPAVWKLNAGHNQIEVAPVDEFGKVGLASSITVEYAKEKGR